LPEHDAVALSNGALPVLLAPNAIAINAKALREFALGKPKALAKRAKFRWRHGYSLAFANSGVPNTAEYEAQTSSNGVGGFPAHITLADAPIGSPR